MATPRRRHCTNGNNTAQAWVSSNSAVRTLTTELKAFDPDDPSANNDEVDADLDGSDNRGAAGTLDLTQGQTAGDGSFWSAFTVAHQPGDNHRVAGTLKQSALNMLNNNNVPPSGTDPGTQDQVALFPGRLSPLLTVWRKLHVETDSMVRPSFTQNTWTTTWSEPTAPVTEPYAGLPSPPWYEIKASDPSGGSANAQFNNGFMELNGTLLSRVFDYFSTAGDDEVIVQLPGGIGGLTAGASILSDDDLSVEATFGAKVWGCDNAYASGSTLLPPDVSALSLRYHPAYIEPVHEGAVSATGGVATFLQNVGFGAWGDYGRALWDQANAPGIRQLPISTSQYWTVMAVSAWQPETGEDGDPDTEGLTNGVSTHGDDGSTHAIWWLGDSYTGLCAVLKACTAGESDVLESYTVAHEIAHTLGLPHTTSGLMVERGAGHEDPFSSESLKDLREYNGP